FLFTCNITIATYFHLIHPLPSSTLFPYPTLFRSTEATAPPSSPLATTAPLPSRSGQTARSGSRTPTVTASTPLPPSVPSPRDDQDRKSTRLNSSHVKISYAVFCLKKKNIRIYNSS